MLRKLDESKFEIALSWFNEQEIENEKQFLATAAKRASDALVEVAQGLDVLGQEKKEVVEVYERALDMLVLHATIMPPEIRELSAFIEDYKEMSV